MNYLQQGNFFAVNPRVWIFIKQIWSPLCLFRHWICDAEDNFNEREKTVRAGNSSKHSVHHLFCREISMSSSIFFFISWQHLCYVLFCSEFLCHRGTYINKICTDVSFHAKWRQALFLCFHVLILRVWWLRSEEKLSFFSSSLCLMSIQNGQLRMNKIIFSWLSHDIFKK